MHIEPLENESGALQPRENDSEWLQKTLRNRCDPV
jgi:hypothetical protein